MILKHTPQKLHIACLSYQGLSSYGMEQTMEQMFPSAEVVTVYPQHLLTHVLRNYDLLVMPGIIGEDSPYPEILPQLKADEVVSCIEENGLALWTSCAATYYCFEKMLYLKRNGQSKIMKGLGIIKGVASGPAYQNMTRIDFEHSSNHDRVLAELSLINSNAIFRALDINGPALYPHAESLVDSFLRYSNIPDQPVAGFTKKIGNGLILGLSSHPEFTLDHPLLPTDFQLHEPSRLSFLAHIKERLVAHWQSTGKLYIQPTSNSIQLSYA
jgi:glutamine amidotransferase-like uncharacterized protein